MPGKALYINCMRSLSGTGPNGTIHFNISFLVILKCVKKNVAIKIQLQAIIFARSNCISGSMRPTSMYAENVAKIKYKAKGNIKKWTKYLLEKFDS